jgi:hypothetical protein
MKGFFCKHVNVVVAKLLTAFKYLTSLGAIHIIRDTHGGGQCHHISHKGGIKI